MSIGRGNHIPVQETRGKASEEVFSVQMCQGLVQVIETQGDGGGIHVEDEAGKSQRQCTRT